MMVMSATATTAAKCNGIPAGVYFRSPRSDYVYGVWYIYPDGAVIGSGDDVDWNSGGRNSLRTTTMTLMCIMCFRAVMSVIV